MNEPIRKAYLSAMGIDIYYPRVNLPGAKLSPAYEFGNDDDLQPVEISQIKIPEVERQVVHGEKLKSPVNRLAKSSLNRKDEDKPAVTLEETLVIKSDSSIEESSDLRFALRYYKVSETVAVLYEYPLQQSSNAAQESEVLLKNILGALGINVDELQLNPESFIWPLAEGFTSNAGDTVAAKQALQGFLLRCGQKDGFQNLLVFAGLIEGLLIGPDSEKDRRDFKSQNFDCFLTLTHSLHSMLSFPQLKKDVWHQLQALYSRIQENK